MKILEKNTSYINCGNIFSKYQLLQEFRERNKGPVLLIVSDEKNITHYKKIADFFGYKYLELQYYSQYIELKQSDDLYISSSDVFHKKLLLDEYNYNKHILKLEKSYDYNIEDIKNTLHDL